MEGGQPLAAAAFAVCKVIASRVEGTVVSLCLVSDATGEVEWLTDRALVEARARPRADAGTAEWSCGACGADHWCASRALVCVMCGAASPTEAARADKKREAARVEMCASCFARTPSAPQRARLSLVLVECSSERLRRVFAGAQSGLPYGAASSPQSQAAW